MITEVPKGEMDCLKAHGFWEMKFTSQPGSALAGHWLGTAVYIWLNHFSPHLKYCILNSSARMKCSKCTGFERIWSGRLPGGSAPEVLLFILLPECLILWKHFFFLFLICSEFCHTLKWNGREFTCLPHPDPPSHLPLHPLPPKAFLLYQFLWDYDHNSHFLDITQTQKSSTR